MSDVDLQCVGTLRFDHLPRHGMAKTPEEKPSSIKQDLQALESLKEAAATCRECPLGFHATQTVWGEWLERPDGIRVLITLHPSALLRVLDDREVAFALWIADLRHASSLVGKDR